MRIWVVMGILIAAVVFLVYGQVLDDFKWSWEERRTTSTESVPPAVVEVLKPGEAEEFKWSWESGERLKGEEKSLAVTPAPPVPKVESSKPIQPASGEGIVAVSAYNELVQENLQLRKRIEELSRDEQALRRENEKLAREIKDNDRRIQQLTETVRKLKEEKALAEAEQKAKPDRILELESKLAASEAQKAKLVEELTLLRAAAARSGGTEPGVEIKPDSDLVKRLEQENATLRQKLVQVDEERQKLLREREQKTAEGSRAEAQRLELQTQLAAAKEQERQYRERIDELVRRTGELERETERLRARLAEKDSTLALKDKELETLRVEIENRERRQARAEQVLRIVEQAEGDLRRATAREQRDLHYNMALMYTQQGKYREAEAEYLQALRIDPNDAETHYNLAILYDDELKDKARAAIHYRRYLKLKPDSPDAETVKLWLLRAETQ